MTSPFLRASVVALGILAASPVLAQATDDETTTTVVEDEGATTAVVEDEVVDGDAQAAEAVTVEDENDGFDWGWLGLLGLLGLAGLRRRPETIVTHPATVTTRTTR